MTSEASSSSKSFKDWFNEARYREIAQQLSAACLDFDREQFLELTLEGLPERELMARLQQTSIAAEAALPGSFVEKVAVLRKIATVDSNGFIGVWYSDFVGKFGLSNPEASLDALRYFTRFGSAEFAIREFILKAPMTTLQELTKWARDKDEHVRRLASEGSRPRLPWGKRLSFLTEDPRPTQKILHTLRADDSLYVRKSVANHLNDISKDNPDFVMATIQSWDQSNDHTAWITKRGLRTLVKNAHTPTLEFLGVGRPPVLSQVVFAISPERIPLGRTISLTLDMTSDGVEDQSLMVDYIVHYVKASGATAAKVFKWKEIALSGGATVSLRKKQMIRDFSARKHYSGTHLVEVQINGKKLAPDSFELNV